MEIFWKFLLDICLFLALVLSTTIINVILVILFQGNISLRSLCFETIKQILQSPWLTAMFTMFFSFSLIASYFCSKIFYVMFNSFNILDVSFVSACFFIFMLLLMDCNKILANIEKTDSLKEMDYYKVILWRNIDSSLTPAIINTLLVVLGMLITYYQFN